MSNLDTSALDGNAAAGAFGAVFGGDVTRAVVTCAHCGQQDIMARLHSYVRGPGITLRCSGCADVLARIVQTPTKLWLDLSGSSSWQLPNPA